MTIDISNNAARVNYTVAQGATQTSFSVPFEFFNDADLSVYVDDVLKTITTHYTVSGGDGSTGTITMSVTGASGGSTVVISRSIAIERTSDFVTGVDINRAALNTQLDTLTAIAADNKDKASRSISAPNSEVNPQLELPDADTRKGKLVGFNETTGNVELSASIADGNTLASISGDIATLADIEDGTDATDAIQTVAGVSSNVTTVAGSIASVNTNATNIASINTNASNIADIQNASANAASALASKNAAATSETNAATSESNAATSATNSANSATDSETSRVASVAAQAAAETAETNAEAAEANVAASAASASTSASNASTSETNAASSAASASTDAGTATTKAGESAASATASANSATASEAAKDAALAALDNFDDRYLGAKASDPTLDNDGNPLVSGALYFNTTDDVMKVYEGSTWVAAYASLSGALLVNNNLSDVASAAASRTNLGLGTAATTASTDYATAAQGVLAASATQPGDLGTAATAAATDFVAVTGDSMTGDLSFGDNDKAIFGAGSDLQIYHDGSSGHSIITESGGGALQLQGENLILEKPDGTNYLLAVAGASGYVKLYQNGADKLTTTSTGIDVTGVITTDGMTTSADINFGDNDKAVFGAGSDLQIYHSSSDNNSYITETGSGSLVIAADQLYVQNAARSETKALFTTDGSVSLRHNNVQKFETTSTGVNVTGEITADGIALGDSQKATFGASDDLQIYHDGANSYVKDSGSGDLYLQGTANVRITNTGGQKMFLGQDGGEVQLYHNGAEKLNTTSTGIDVTGTAVTDGVTVNGTLDIEEVREFVQIDTNTGSSTFAVDSQARAIVYLTANQTANRTLNFTNVNSLLSTGQSYTATVLATQGSTAYYFNAYQVDGSTVTPKWSGGSAPTGGNASGIDVYTFTIIKTANATFTVLASQTQFA